jgi:adenylyl-sulfate kinase
MRVGKGSGKSKKCFKRGFVLWFTGLSGAGKTVVANKVAAILDERGYDVERLDGDIVRKRLTKDLGFSREDRAENLSRVGYVASLLSKREVGVIASFVSPYRKERGMVKRMVTNFIEVYVSTPLEVCEERDVKGLYKKARKGEIKEFTGVSDPYEPPKRPDIDICGDKPRSKVKDLAEEVVVYLRKNNYL